jgi:hypothetical protein
MTSVYSLAVASRSCFFNQPGNWIRHEAQKPASSPFGLPHEQTMPEGGRRILGGFAFISGSGMHSQLIV